MVLPQPKRGLSQDQGTHYSPKKGNGSANEGHAPKYREGQKYIFDGRVRFKHRRLCTQRVGERCRVTGRVRKSCCPHGSFRIVPKAAITSLRGLCSSITSGAVYLLYTSPGRSSEAALGSIEFAVSYSGSPGSEPTKSRSCRYKSDSPLLPGLKLSTLKSSSCIFIFFTILPNSSSLGMPPGSLISK